MDSLNWFAIISVSVAACMGGSVWFGPVFGRLWMRIHHGDRRFSPEEMRELSRGMWKLIAGEFLSLLLMIAALEFLIRALPELSGIQCGLLVWSGFVLPTYVSATIWWADQKKWMPAKIALSAGYRLVVLLAAGYVSSVW